MILPIISSNSLALQETVKNIEPDYCNLSQLVSDMWETVYVTKSVGLTAPEVGVPLKLLIINGKTLFENKVDVENCKITMINPKIINSSGMSVSYVESLCIGSSKDTWVHVEYYDEYFFHHSEVFHGVIARIIQSKYNYLENKMFIDILKSIQKKITDMGKYNFTSF